MGRSRLHFTPGAHEVVYVPKTRHDESELAEAQRIDAIEFVARTLVQIPDPRRHLVRCYGAYSNDVARIHRPDRVHQPVEERHDGLPRRVAATRI